jgi:methyl-accepting chemotaxis protein
MINSIVSSSTSVTDFNKKFIGDLSIMINYVNRNSDKIVKIKMLKKAYEYINKNIKNWFKIVQKPGSKERFIIASYNKIIDLLNQIEQNKNIMGENIKLIEETKKTFAKSRKILYSLIITFENNEYHPTILKPTHGYNLRKKSI